MSSTRIFIIDPNQEIQNPYRHVAELYTASAVNRYASIEQAIPQLILFPPTLILLSTSFSASKQLEFLTALKARMKDYVIPVIFVVSWAQRLHTLLGTEWGQQVGILHTLASKEEVVATLKRVTA